MSPGLTFMPIGLRRRTSGSRPICRRMGRVCSRPRCGSAQGTGGAASCARSPVPPVFANRLAALSSWGCYLWCDCPLFPHGGPLGGQAQDTCTSSIQRYRVITCAYACAPIPISAHQYIKRPAHRHVPRCPGATRMVTESLDWPTCGCRSTRRAACKLARARPCARPRCHRR